jgi:hypothetical protein
MASLLGSLSDAQGRELRQNIYYLNMGELREFCDSHGIPYAIYFESEDGRVRKSRDADRKGIVIDRVLHFLNTGKIKPRTVFAKSVVRFAPVPSVPVKTERIFYGQYKDSDRNFLELMKQLTDGAFEAGAISQEVLRACWTRGAAPTYREFAKLWLNARKDHTQPNPEWAFLTDRAKGIAGADWKQLRIEKASAAIAVLKKIAPRSHGPARTIS